MARSRIPQAVLQELIARTDLVALIQARVSLKKQGQYYSGLCPFHEESTPSFKVHAQQHFYHCYGCSAHGSAINFLMEYDRLSFLEAVQSLAKAAGIDLHSEQIEDYSEDYEVLSRVAAYYEQELKKSPLAIAYLKHRGLTGRVARYFRLGYAPHTAKHLACWKEHAILARHGLIVGSSNGGFCDRFRNRIMIPIRDACGRVLAFGARCVPQDPSQRIERHEPKYLNSPESPLFKKREILYGVYEISRHRPAPKSVLVVEGYMDVIALHQYGLFHAVATLGTAVQVGHLKNLLSRAQELIFCFDGDEAGRKAAWRTLCMALRVPHQGMIRFVFLSDPEDPDSLVRRVGALGFQQRLRQAKTLSVVFFEELERIHDLTTTDGKACYAQEAVQHLETIPSGIFRDLMFQALAERLKLYVHDLRSVSRVLTAPQAMPRNTSFGLLERAMMVLLQEPRVCLHISSDQLRCLSVCDAHAVFVRAVRIVQKHPETEAGMLMHYFTTEETAWISACAAHTLPFSPDALIQEWTSLIECLCQQPLEARVEQLMKQSQQQALNTQEESELLRLLSILKRPDHSSVH